MKMKSKALIPLALGLTIGLVALKLGVDAVRRARGNPAVPDLSVVVTTVDIGPTLQITGEMVVVKKTPHTPLLPADAFNKVEQVVGRVTNKTIPAGTPLSPSLVAPEGTLPGLQVKIEEGYRAVSVKTDEVTGVAYQLLPGSYVDVLVVMDVERAKKKETLSRVILQHIQVAAVGQLRGDPGADHDANKAKSVTLLVPAEDVPKLHLAQTKGRITLAMRGGEDELLTSESKAQESELFGETTEDKAAAKSPTGLAPTPALGAAAAAASGAPGATGLNANAMGMFADATPVPPPFTTTVINGPLGADSSGQVLRVTYKTANSLEVVGVTKGRTTGDSSSMTFGSGEPQGSMQVRNLFADRDRVLRRQGAQGETTNQENDNLKETGD